MTIKTRLSDKDYIQLSLVVLYQKPAIKLFIGIALAVFIVALFGLIAEPGSVTISNFILPVLILAMPPLFTWYNSKKMLRSNKLVTKPYDYIIEADSFGISGELFNARFSWDKIYKVTKTKKWLLVWQHSQLAYGIPLRDTWDGEIAALKDILIANKVKNNL
ncbi:YcxB family protein [Foetidibacter luteolus]|uniref:YcxB family protein n=1 Tax=Foetidibacter luteolus TaxID=2608880 RepID=UPI00129AB701|nr:YcxB family protein [Foetidibacter luteolus]